ncbi:zinc finger, CCHC-type containing protein [Tanacetum coccineum]
MLVVRERGLRTNPKTKVDAIAWTYEPAEGGFVLYMGDDHFAPVHGKGSVVLEFSFGKSITLFNVLYVPKLRRNLISGPVLNKSGYKYVYESDKYILLKSGMFVEFGYYNNGIFMLNLNKVHDDSGSVYMSSSTVVNSLLCHARLEHVNYKRMLEMSKDDLIPAIDENPEKYTTWPLLGFRAPKGKLWVKRVFTASLLDMLSIPRPKNIIPNSDESQRGDHLNDVPSETPEPRNLVELRDQEIKLDHTTLTTKVLRRILEPIMMLCNLEMLLFEKKLQMDLQREIKIDGTIDKFKARLVIRCFRQKERIDYFDTHAPVARIMITTIRLLLTLAAIHNLVIHQMDVKTAFLNGDLEEKVYMKQPEGFVMSDKYVYRKFDDSDKGVIICLYVDDMLIFGTELNQIDKTKKFLSSRFSMKDMGEEDVILGIMIKRENNGIVIIPHYIEKILKKFNREDCSLVSTPMDPVEKLMPNTDKPMDQLKYSRAISRLMYGMTSTRLDIAYVISFDVEAYSDPSYINHVEDLSSTSGWVFRLRGGVISWASKKQTCITSSTIEYEFVALATDGKEAEWL